MLSLAEEFSRQAAAENKPVTKWKPEVMLGAEPTVALYCDDETRDSNRCCHGNVSPATAPSSPSSKAIMILDAPQQNCCFFNSTSLEEAPNPAHVFVPVLAPCQVVLSIFDLLHNLLSKVIHKVASAVAHNLPVEKISLAWI